MDPISFREVAHLVNRISGTRIDVDTPKLAQPEQFAVYGGVVSSSGFSFPFDILYVYSDATKDGIRAAYSWLNRHADKTKVRVIYAPSVTVSIIDEFKQRSVECMSLADYFASFMRQQTETYIDKIRNLTYANYIDPQIKCPVTPKRRVPNPVLEFLTSPNYGAPKGDVAVLLGEPGQGKTHMSKYLAVELTKLKRIPIYVHSEQWTQMKVEDMSSIWKTIVASFRYFDAPIGWAEGAERDFIRVSLKLGIFRLIFDGFDEFILWNRGTIDARESLRELLSLAEEAGTTLCITSRTSFYQSEISAQEFEKSNQLFEFKILPFDTNHAGNYFKNRFGADSPFVAHAVRLFERLIEDSTGAAIDFVGRGFFLTLIADLVSRGETGQVNVGGKQTRLQWIMEALCQREQIRQTLPLDAQTQLNVFREFAALAANGEPRTSQTLAFVLDAVGGLNAKQTDELIKTPAKLKDHPLLSFDGNNWNFNQAQIEFFLLAERILTLASESNESTELRELINGLSLNKSLHTEVATALIQQIFASLSEVDALAECKKIIATLVMAGQLSLLTTSNGCHQFAGTVALLAAGKTFKRGDDRTERTAMLLNLLPAGQLVGVQFVGTISSLDLRGLVIRDCHFDSATFANCRFNSATKFLNCSITDLRIQNCEQFGMVVFEGVNYFDDESKNLVQAEMISAGTRQYLESNLVADIDCLVKRFLPRETSGFKNVEERNLSRGVVGHSIHKTVIIDSFKRECLTSHPKDGMVVYAVKDEVKSDFMFYVGNGVPTGKLAALKTELSRKLIPSE